MAQKNSSSPTALRAIGAYDQTARKGHATHRELRGRDRRAEKRTERDELVIVLHPALFEQTYGVAA
jgi:hypothetical protein